MVKIHLVETKEVKLRYYPNSDQLIECNNADMHLATLTKFRLTFEGNSIKFNVWEEDLHKCKDSFSVDRLLWYAYDEAKGRKDVQEIILKLGNKEGISVGES